jgi:hypothetical protein
MKFNGWEAGVIPIAFAPDISQARRDQFMRICNQGWGTAAYVSCVHRTSQIGFLTVTSSESDRGPAFVDDCYSAVGQSRRLVRYELHLGRGCWSDATVYHELGHAFGFVHEHQRPDRDEYVQIQTENVQPDKAGNFNRITSLNDRQGPYDFMSIMHYRHTAFAVSAGQATIVPQSGYGSYATTMGTSPRPTSLDEAAIADLYANYFRSIPAVFVSPNRTFNRVDFLDAMERLDAFYYSRLGLARSAGLSINGRPDFQGIATWIFDIYLGARSAGLSPDMSFGAVVTDITQSDEWKAKHPGWTPGQRSAFTASVQFDRNEFLQVLDRLDAFYAAPEGLQRPDGLSILGGPDFLGIATWIFDVYLNDRLTGGTPNSAWTRVENAIRASDEWRSKH